MDALGMTSRLVAASRERESARADRLFDDPFAGALAGDEGRAFLAGMESIRMAGAFSGSNAENPYIPIRTRFFDDLLLEAARDGMAQIVILAAGMDDRAFRLDFPAGTSIFELDRPEVLAYKEPILTRLGAVERGKRVVIPIDLRDDFMGPLTAAGFSQTQPAMFLVEGLTPYLPNVDAAASIASRIAGGSAPGSMIALDIVGESFLKSQWTKPYLDFMAASGAPWLFGTDQPEVFLKHAGFTDIRVVQPAEVGHGRWPYPSLPRIVPGIPRSYLVTGRS